MHLAFSRQQYAFKTSGFAYLHNELSIHRDQMIPVYEEKRINGKSCSNTKSQTPPLPLSDSNGLFMPTPRLSRPHEKDLFSCLGGICDFEH